MYKIFTSKTVHFYTSDVVCPLKTLFMFLNAKLSAATLNAYKISHFVVFGFEVQSLSIYTT